MPPRSAASTAVVRRTRRQIISHGPAYDRIARELTAEIAGERCSVGDRLPTEAQLAERFEVSRSTVRAALAALETKGLLDRKPKVGTVVRAKSPSTRYVVSVGSLAELLVFLGSTMVRPMRWGEVLAKGSLAADLACAPGERWTHVQAIRTPTGGALPISWTDYYIRPAYGDVVASIGRSPGPIYPLLEARYGVQIDRIEQDIGASTLPAAVARAISAKSGGPALRVIHRLISLNAGTVYCTVSLYPADRFRYVQALQRA
jgi:GntR family transcriptional regulator